MMKIKTTDLSGPALNWAVAKAEGLNPNSDPEVRRQYVGYSGFAEANGFGYAIKHYSTGWEDGGPIIEREELGLKRNAPCSRGREWEASPSITAKGVGGKWGYGPTPLIAAMRCYVASKLGDEIEIPEELLK